MAAVLSRIRLSLPCTNTHRACPAARSKVRMLDRRAWACAQTVSMETNYERLQTAERKKSMALPFLPGNSFSDPTVSKKTHCASILWVTYAIYPGRFIRKHASTFAKPSPTRMATPSLSDQGWTWAASRYLWTSSTKPIWTNWPTLVQRSLTATHLNRLPWSLSRLMSLLIRR